MVCSCMYVVFSNQFKSNLESILTFVSILASFDDWSRTNTNRSWVSDRHISMFKGLRTCAVILVPQRSHCLYRRRLTDQKMVSHATLACFALTTNLIVCMFYLHISTAAEVQHVLLSLTLRVFAREYQVLFHFVLCVQSCTHWFWIEPKKYSHFT